MHSAGSHSCGSDSEVPERPNDVRREREGGMEGEGILESGREQGGSGRKEGRTSHLGGKEWHVSTCMLGDANYNSVRLDQIRVWKESVCKQKIDEGLKEGKFSCGNYSPSDWSLRKFAIIFYNSSLIMKSYVCSFVP